MGNIVYYTVFGDDMYYENLQLSIRSLRDFGNYQDEIIVFSDKPCNHPEITNIIIPMKNSSESIATRLTCYKHFDFSGYDAVMYLDLDILAVQDIHSLFDFESDFVYFEQHDTYYTSGIVNAGFFDRELFFKNWYKKPINAGQYVVRGEKFQEIMKLWYQVCLDFRDKKIFELDLGFKKTWKDQCGLNYIIRKGMIHSQVKHRVVRFPSWPFDLQNQDYLLYHYAAFPVQAANFFMKRQLQGLNRKFQLEEMAPSL